MAVHKKYDRNVLGRGLDNIVDAKGRGLDALINTKDVETEGSSNLSEIPIEKIMSNPNQPSREFEEEALEELANSIRESGIIRCIRKPSARRIRTERALTWYGCLPEKTVRMNHLTSCWFRAADL